MSYDSAYIFQRSSYTIFESYHSFTNYFIGNGFLGFIWPNFRTLDKSLPVPNGTIPIIILLISIPCLIISYIININVPSPPAVITLTFYYSYYYLSILSPIYLYYSSNISYELYLLIKYDPLLDPLITL